MFAMLRKEINRGLPHTILRKTKFSRRNFRSTRCRTRNFSNNGHMIKFQLFDSSEGHQCRFGEIATFVVSISHYMRAYFNYQALSYGSDFKLPDDAAYLNVSAQQSVVYSVLRFTLTCQRRPPELGAMPLCYT